MIRVSSNCTRHISELVHLESYESLETFSSLKRILRIEMSEEEEEEDKPTASLDTHKAQDEPIQRQFCCLRYFYAFMRIIGKLIAQCLYTELAKLPTPYVSWLGGLRINL